MKMFAKFAVTPLIAVAMMTGASMSALAQTPQTQNSATEDWNTPPAGTEQAQAGFRDGIEAAKLDKLAGRRIDPMSSYLYTHPPVKKGPARDAYLNNFVTGYKAAVAHSSAS